MKLFAPLKVSLVAITKSHAGVNADALIAAEKARNAALLAGISDNLRYIHSSGYLEICNAAGNA